MEFLLEIAKSFGYTFIKPMQERVLNFILKAMAKHFAICHCLLRLMLLLKLALSKRVAGALLLLLAH